MRIVILRLPWGGGSTKPYDIRGDNAHLLSVAERASLATVHHAAMRFARSERLHGMRSRAVNLRLKLACRENAQDNKRKDEEAKACYKCDHKRIAADRWGSVKDLPGRAALLASIGHLLSLGAWEYGRHGMFGAGQQANPEQEEARNNRNAGDSPDQPERMHGANGFDPG